ncbi:hypothetical protein SNEBB_010198 [Seison nebaliae]|nr:hypothetical protein SNEBB_010198 [Seison nebaliae]
MPQMFLDNVLNCNPPMNCQLDCQFGLKRSTTDMCRICECADDPCMGVTCRAGEECITKFPKNVASCFRSDIVKKVNETMTNFMQNGMAGFGGNFFALNGNQQQFMSFDGPSGGGSGMFGRPNRRNRGFRGMF